jgi:hypothetical protein
MNRFFDAHRYAFWQIMPDGTAEASNDHDAVNRGEALFFGSPEGAILNGGVLATAFTRRIEKTYNAIHWLATGELVENGKNVTTRITASPDMRKVQKAV